MIPAFEADGSLPVGLYAASEAEIVFRFGTSTRRRTELAIRLRRWIELARAVSARRLLVDGSFVTAKPDPGDIDAAIWLPSDFQEQVARGAAAALELNNMLRTGQPKEIFPADDEDDWNWWIKFFSQTRIANEFKGLVEVQL